MLGELPWVGLRQPVVAGLQGLPLPSANEDPGGSRTGALSSKNSGDLTPQILGSDEGFKV